MLWRVSSRPIRSRSKPPGFILPCQPALADRPPSGPEWLHEIKFDGYRVLPAGRQQRSSQYRREINPLVIDSDLTASIRAVTAVAALVGRAILALLRGVAIYRQALAMSPYRRHAAPFLQAPSIVPPARGTCEHPTETRLRYSPPRRRGLIRSDFWRRYDWGSMPERHF
jgi:hypothetical protein